MGRMSFDVSINYEVIPYSFIGHSIEDEIIRCYLQQDGATANTRLMYP
jgi:hypothetical protein